ncbi:hypothetical protein QR674_07905 [Acinetobacter chinensis]|uniref:Lipoprotein n=1 Tax=Acinetobacter chinensis TaxID=2004650 RepID=A0ABU3WER2_9GAMM|nr:hypothetical protein [Acinetobacter chinensis]MDV2468906.1 hypothetical protein [Acinetobacter chinensis]
MKKIFLAALILGLIGCTGDDSSDVKSEGNNIVFTQSDNFSINTVNQTQTVYPLQVYSASLPLRGWGITGSTALGPSVLYDAVKDNLKSAALITPNATQVAKVIARGGAGYAVSVAVEQLLGAVDWVMDPANNQVIYNKYPDNVDPKFYFKSNDGTEFNNADDMGFYDFSKRNWIGAQYVETFCDVRGVCSFVALNPSTGRKSAYYAGARLPRKVELPKQEYSIALEAIAQQIINNADSGTTSLVTPAQEATVAAAQEIMDEAQQDEVKAEPIVDEFERNADDDERPECKTIRTLIHGNVGSLSLRHQQMLLDRYDLYNKHRTEPHPVHGSWEQLGEKYAIKQTELDGNMAAAESIRCAVPQSAEVWSNISAPDKPAIAGGYLDGQSRNKTIILRR